MAATPESKVKGKIKELLKEHGVYYAMPIGTGYGSSGVPDFLCCVNGYFVAIEAKAGKGQATALQLKHLRDVNASGGYTCIINETNLDYLKAVITECKERSNV
jgi:pantoate kinase